MVLAYSIFLFLLGTIFGSFINVLIVRYDPDKSFFSSSSTGGRSHCPHCHTTLRWFELIPLLSYLLQLGKCRTCGKRLSIRYFAMEVLFGVLTLGIPLYLNSFFGISANAFFTGALPYWYYALLATWVVVSYVFVAMTFIDLKFYIIPDELTISLVVLGLIITGIMVQADQSTISAYMQSRLSFLVQYISMFPIFPHLVWNHIAGAFIGFFFFLMLSVITRGRGIGFGDVKLAFALGILFGWPDIAVITILSFIAGALWSLLLMLLKSKGMKDRVPFAPFFVFGAFLTFFFGSVILKGYFTAFGLQ